MVFVIPSLEIFLFPRELIVTSFVLSAHLPVNSLSYFSLTVWAPSPSVHWDPISFTLQKHPWTPCLLLCLAGGFLAQHVCCAPLPWILFLPLLHSLLCQAESNFEGS